METDYIIVGGGYAGLFFAHQLIKNNKSFILFTNKTCSASEVSAGMINPAILKKFTTFWLAQEQIDFLHNTLNEIGVYTGNNYFINAPVHRIFHDKIEKELWLKKSDTDNLKPFLSKNILSYSCILNPFGTGKVMQSGRLAVSEFFKDMYKYLEKQNQVHYEEFFYNEVNIETNTYKNINFKHLVFCEGIGIHRNPYFSTINIQPNKGHHLFVKLSEPILDEVTFKKKHFLFHLKDDLYYYGGTYDRIHTDDVIDEESVEMLSDGLKEFYPHPFEIVDVEYGFRPTVKDRRPILGKHKNYPNLYVFNGLGARGVLNGCFFANELFNFIEFAKPLHDEVDLKRFY